ncbi:hypothetical protein HNR77_004273 [Paenibacillus sp. JGP012]|uniref:Uncharacterized protein n=1 Tax=Paenibacillus silvae TaxID=1325358 RepID=A0A2W6QJH0_9BACL|nr:hypothetical protein [Paenibacillus sp. JGP012]MBB6023173.1 hypothetical protein [Paenibacillus sp. JGP012]PZT57293.1 hypothetical protein DN757_02465 [Paenibacillus silvae]
MNTGIKSYNDTDTSTIPWRKESLFVHVNRSLLKGLAWGMALSVPLWIAIIGWLRLLWWMH